MESLPKENYNPNLKSKLLLLPDYLIENYIFPYLSGKELFFNVRAVHPYLHEIVKSSWGNSIKEEMFSQLKNLAFIYEKDADSEKGWKLLSEKVGEIQKKINQVKPKQYQKKRWNYLKVFLKKEKI